MYAECHNGQKCSKNFTSVRTTVFGTVIYRAIQVFVIRGNLMTCGNVMTCGNFMTCGNLMTCGSPMTYGNLMTCGNFITTKNKEKIPSGFPTFHEAWDGRDRRNGNDSLRKGKLRHRPLNHDKQV